MASDQDIVNKIVEKSHYTVTLDDYLEWMGEKSEGGDWYAAERAIRVVFENYSKKLWKNACSQEKGFMCYVLFYLLDPAFLMKNGAYYGAARLRRVEQFLSENKPKKKKQKNFQ